MSTLVIMTSLSGTHFAPVGATLKKSYIHPVTGRAHFQKNPCRFFCCTTLHQSGGTMHHLIFPLIFSKLDLFTLTFMADDWTIGSCCTTVMQSGAPQISECTTVVQQLFHPIRGSGAQSLLYFWRIPCQSWGKCCLIF